MKYYDTKKISDNFWLIFENYAPDSAITLGLVIGQEKAALIDSGMGMFGAELKDVVRSITDKPIINLLTHGHPDHIAGSVLFDEVYMNARDESQIPRLATERRLGDTKMFSHDDPEVKAHAEANCIDCSGFQYRNMDAGDRFDLGGTELEILALPGHSQGSVAIFNRADGYAMVGDAFSNRVPASSMPSLDGFKEMADRIQIFLDTVPETCVLYGGHSNEPVQRELIVQEMHAARELAEGCVEADEDVFLPISPIPNQKKHVYGEVGITYNPAILG